jgi:hypothetical protein
VAYLSRSCCLAVGNKGGGSARGGVVALWRRRSGRAAWVGLFGVSWSWLWWCGIEHEGAAALTYVQPSPTWAWRPGLRGLGVSLLLHLVGIHRWWWRKYSRWLHAAALWFLPSYLLRLVGHVMDLATWVRVCGCRGSSPGRWIARMA